MKYTTNVTIELDEKKIAIDYLIQVRNELSRVDNESSREMADDIQKALNILYM